jgi:hypothetical protein
MKTHLFGTLFIATALCTSSQSFAARSASPASIGPRVFAESESESEDGPPEAVIRKLAAMMADQTIKRNGTKESDGKIAPKDATVYDVDINNADGKLAFKAFLFKAENGKWTLFDEAGHTVKED